MIHIIITIREKPMQVVLQKFEAKKGATKKEHDTAHVVYSFLYPLLKRAAIGAKGSLRVIE